MIELLSSGPETVVLNADAVYVTTYSVLNLTMTLHRCAYFTNAEKSLPLSEVIWPFIIIIFSPWNILKVCQKLLKERLDGMTINPCSEREQNCRTVQQN